MTFWVLRRALQDFGRIEAEFRRKCCTWVVQGHNPLSPNTPRKITPIASNAMRAQQKTASTLTMLAVNCQALLLMLCCHTEGEPFAASP
jgi:hypothetical protein